MSTDDYGYQKIIDFFNTAASLVGQSITDEKWYKFPHSIYRYFCLAILFCGLSAGYPAMKNNLHDMTHIARCNLHYTIVVTGLIKLFIYMKTRHKFVELIKRTKQFRQTHILTAREHEICDKWTKKSAFIPKLIYGCYLGTVIPAALMAYFTHTLPYALQLPYISNTDFPGYQINFVHQVCDILIGSSMSCMIDSMFFVTSQEACIRLDVIKEKMSFIGKSSEDNTKSAKDQLREVHLIHLDTNEYLYFQNALYMELLFLLFVTSTFMLTNLMMNVATSSIIDFGMYSLVMSISFQIFLWCWFGEIVRTRMSDMVQAMYDNHWYNLGLSEQKSLMIMMSCSQKEYCLSAGGLVDLTLATFVAIMKSAYSYYAVMKDFSG